jgi:UDP-2-acetamido-3-amino-2,3-dideoxy-glucuronate N-acetyltransferase
LTDLLPFVHPSSVVDEGTLVGAGTKIWHFVHVASGARIGENCVLGQGVYVGGRVTIGSGVKIQNNVSVYDGVMLEDDVFCGPSMVFTNVTRPRSFISRKAEFSDTLVKKGATLGANCTIVCGTTIGRYAMVGAGSVVTRDVADYELVVGAPARRVGWICVCGERVMPEKGLDICARCGRRYSLADGRLINLSEVEQDR